MLLGIAARRLELAQKLRVPAGTQLLPLSQLRFTLGVSSADLRVPFDVAPNVTQLAERAAIQLGWMVTLRLKPWLTQDERDELLLNETLASTPEPSPSLGPIGTNPDARGAAEIAPLLHPALPGGVLGTWMGQGGGGRSLVALVAELLKRAFAEMPASGGREETPVWVALMLGQPITLVQTALREVAYPASLAPRLYAAVGTGLYLAVRLGLELASRGASWPARLQERVEAALSPRALIGSDPQLGNANTLYGCVLTAGALDLEKAPATLAQSPATWVAEWVRMLEKDSGRALQAELAVAQAELRSQAITLVRALEGAEATPPELLSLAQGLALAPAGLDRVLGEDDRERRELAKTLGTLEAGKPLAAALKAFSPKKPARCLNLSHSEALDRYARASTGLTADVWLDRQFRPVRERITWQSSSEGTTADYESGKLYLISLHEGPFLKPRQDLEQGHLFVDMKDFTRRTSLLGQTAIADFLRREFYSPILNAAKRHYGGLSHLSDKGGITLNNLLGDAISFSGQIDALLALAISIRQHLLEYQRRLSRELSVRVVTVAVKQVEAEFARRPKTPEWAAARELALARAQGEVLEAGVFVAHGPAPLIIVIEDEVFGVSKVAIADRINQSARGTARAASARGDLDQKLAEERAKRNHPGLKLAWSVIVGGGDIYNAGAAVSEEALLAFCEAKQNERQLRLLEVDPAKLHPDLHTHHYFPPGPVKVIASFAHGKLAELFRFAGRCLFKGLEQGGGVAVWELVNESPVYELLKLHHALEWKTGGVPFDGTALPS